jgi:hypothetical protein
MLIIYLRTITDTAKRPDFKENHDMDWFKPFPPHVWDSQFGDTKYKYQDMWSVYLRPFNGENFPLSDKFDQLFIEGSNIIATNEYDSYYFDFFFNFDDLQSFRNSINITDPTLAASIREWHDIYHWKISEHFYEVSTNGNIEKKTYDLPPLFN